MYTLNQLIKASKQSLSSKQVKICVLGDCSTQFLTKAIKGYGIIEGVNIHSYESDYDQITEQILNPNSEMYSFEPDIIIMYMCAEKLYEEFCNEEQQSKFAEKTLETIRSYHERINANCGAKILQFNFVEINDNIFGNYGSKTEVAFVYQIRKLNYLFQELVSHEKNVFPIDLLSVQSQIGYNELFPVVQYHNAKLTIDLKYIPLVAKNVIDVIKSMNGNRKKCIITDLDNTLWGGVVGDMELGELEIGNIGRGHAFSEFQRYLKQLKNRGVILAVCSKNNEETAKLPFEQLDDMVLKLTDFLIFIANWEDKATNIKSIISSLNISADSVVFIDDNIFERNTVKSLIPEVSVPDMPEDPADYIKTLISYNYFETSSYSVDDKKRTEQYKTEFKRKESMADYADYDSYLKSLDMRAVATPFEKNNFARIADLTQRSNQFNLRTIRYTENDISLFAESKQHLTLSFSLMDKYGSYGLISVVIMKKKNANTVCIDTWVLSCRVLKRGMEEFIMNEIIKTAARSGFSYVEAEYIPSQKNGMVKDIYLNYGFKKIGENYFRIKIADYIVQSCNISSDIEEVIS